MKTFLAAFGLIFLAELGDKTQLAAIAMASQTGKPWHVFVGAALAFSALTLAGVFLGVGIAKVVPAAVIQKVAGALFVAFGVLIFFGKF
ncbi:MAG: TMEM165/GDT1 family protein [candidate division Zixibacteria bacterium]|nr:TMEM165/GDT1 family protein [candidate division Zixibacteria bacterium]